MNTQSYNCCCKESGSVEDLTEIGDFKWARNGQTDVVEFLLINAPAADGSSRGVVAVPVKEGANSPVQQWGWDGNRERPTLTPSIHWVGHWHGFLRNGRLESC